MLLLLVVVESNMNRQLAHLRYFWYCTVYDAAGPTQLRVQSVPGAFPRG